MRKPRWGRREACDTPMGYSKRLEEKRGGGGGWGAGVVDEIRVYLEGEGEVGMIVWTIELIDVKQ